MTHVASMREAQMPARLVRRATVGRQGRRPRFHFTLL